LSGHTYFFYGSLMDRELLEAVIDRDSQHLSFTPGALGGFVAEIAHGYSFPTLVPRVPGSVNGLIAHGLQDADVSRIAYFEDTEYAPVAQGIETDRGTITASVFMSTQSLRSSGVPWDFSHWRVHHKAVLVAVTRRVMREHYGITPFEEIDEHWHRIKAEVESDRTPEQARAR
jgi:Gamma-glutamyl cyclotransferase, AIG2-like